MFYKHSKYKKVSYTNTLPVYLSFLHTLKMDSKIRRKSFYLFGIFVTHIPAPPQILFYLVYQLKTGFTFGSKKKSHGAKYGEYVVNGAKN